MFTKNTSKPKVVEMNKMEWPELNQTPQEVAKSPIRPIQVFKKQTSPSVFKLETISTPVNVNKGSPWAMQQSNNAFSLKDVIDEEMKNVTTKVSRKPAEVVVKTVSEEPVPLKTWKSVSNESSSVGSFSKILEMEMSSQTRVQTNRPLNSIQLEERAIQELKRFYNVDACVDENITIEIIEDTPKVTPMWKKN